MSNVEIYIVVEGQTEQTFVRDVLAPIMAPKGIYLHAALIGKPGHKGGDVRFDRAKIDVCNFLKQRGDTFVSTMFDYFRIDPKWPGLAIVRREIENGVSLTTIQKAEILEAATYDEIVAAVEGRNAENRFIPYIEMYEFEALLFSDIKILSEITEVEIVEYENILKEFNSPEEINDDPINAPSKRILTLNKEYRKIAMGKTISEAIGIQAIRKQCPHFNAWLTKLENLKTVVDAEE